MFKYRIEKHNFDFVGNTFVQKDLDEFIHVTEKRILCRVHHRSKNLYFFLFSFLFLTKGRRDFHHASPFSRISGLYKLLYNRTLCYYRIVRTLYYLFPTQPCIESQKVTRFHVTQLCRRSFLQKLGAESFKSTKYISPFSVNISHLTQFYTMFEASWKTKKR